MKNQTTYEDVLEEYIERVGKNLVGAIIMNNEKHILAITLRDKKIKDEILENILKQIYPSIQDLTNEDFNKLMSSKSIETDEYFILLTSINENIVLISLFALNAMIDSFVGFTKIASYKLKKVIDDYTIDSTENQKSISPKVEDKNTISRTYNCNYCSRTHTIELPKDIIKDKDYFPIPYVFLHSSSTGLRDLLTTLYIDSEFNIRGVEVLKVENSDIFSETLTRKITEKLMEQIEKLENENQELRDLMKNIDLKKMENNEIKRKKKLPDSPNYWKINQKPNKKKLRLKIVNLLGKPEKIKTVKISKKFPLTKLRSEVKKLFNISSDSFYFSYGGIIMDEKLTIMDYKIKQGEDIVIIPAKYKVK